ncbi:MAG: hypothetical protein V9H69_12295 [Anaerolineae bacterium]
MRSYDKLASRLTQIRPARPITRGMVLGAVLALWLAMALIGIRVLPTFPGLLALSVAASLIFVVFLVPPALYGTSVEAIEGRVLVVVEALQDLLDHGDMQFSEAAYFQVRDTLRQAADELRQQVWLNHASRLATLSGPESTEAAVRITFVTAQPAGQTLVSIHLGRLLNQRLARRLSSYSVCSK